LKNTFTVPQEAGFAPGREMKGTHNNNKSMNDFSIIVGCPAEKVHPDYHKIVFSLKRMNLAVVLEGKKAKNRLLFVIQRKWRKTS
jgi:hypothetical protein